MMIKKKIKRVIEGSVIKNAAGTEQIYNKHNKTDLQWTRNEQDVDALWRKKYR